MQVSNTKSLFAYDESNRPLTPNLFELYIEEPINNGILFFNKESLTNECVINDEKIKETIDKMIQNMNCKEYRKHYAIPKYLEKRNKRIWKKEIIYKTRHDDALSRKRKGGKFCKN